MKIIISITSNDKNRTMVGMEFEGQPANNSELFDCKMIEGAVLAAMEAIGSMAGNAEIASGDGPAYDAAVVAMRKRGGF